MGWIKWQKVGVILVAGLFLLTGVLEMDAWARAGGGTSSGSRGSRSYSSPSKSYSAPTKAAPGPSSPLASPMPQQAQPPSMWRTIAAGAMGGFLGSMHFSGLGHGFGGGTGGSGIGLMEILLLGGLLYGIYWFMKRRRQEKEAAAGPYQMQSSSPSFGQTASYGQPPAASNTVEDDVATGISHIRQMDPSFDERKFTDLCTDIFFGIQGAWANRDMAAARPRLTDEMFGLLQADADKLKAEKKINKLDNIAVRSVEITEVWQEGGRDFITVRYLANLLDYTVSETGDLLSGNRTEPVKFEEYWTFTRPVGVGSWQLSAINQAD